MKQKQAEILFEQVYQKTYQEAYGYILAKTGDIFAVEGLLSNSYAEFFRRLLRTANTDAQNKRSLLFRVIQKYLNAYYKNLKETIPPKTGRKIKKYEQLLQDELDKEFPPLTKDELNRALNSILALVADHAIEQRRAFILYYLFEFSISQVANELNITEECAGNHIYLLTKEIRVKIEGQAAKQE